VQARTRRLTGLDALLFVGFSSGMKLGVAVREHYTALHYT
jgi:hypothetical protein